MEKLSKFVIPAILIVLAILIVVALLTPGPVSNYGVGPAHKDGVAKYEPLRK